MRRVNDESGTTVVLVAVLMVLFLTMVSFVVDTGRLLDEHGQLSNGADGAALAVAATCARAPSSCTGSATGLATSVAGGNARQDGQSHVEVLDLRPSAPGAGTVTVGLRSLEPGQPAGSGAVSLALPRSGGAGSSVVRDAASAAWGPAVLAPALPTAFSACDVERILAAQGGPLEGPPPAGATGSVVAFHDPDRDGDDDDDDDDDDSDWPTCRFDGRTLDTGFGELRRSGGCDATTDVRSATWVRRDPGSDLRATRDCLQQGQIHVVPVFDRTCERHGDRCPGSLRGRDGYRVAGLAAVVVTGWRLPGSTTSPAPRCPPESQPPRCISVIVTRVVVPGVPIAASSGARPLGYGVSAVRLVPSP